MVKRIALFSLVVVLAGCGRLGEECRLAIAVSREGSGTAVEVRGDSTMEVSIPDTCYEGNVRDSRAKPNAGWTFLNWWGDLTGTDRTLRLPSVQT